MVLLVISNILQILGLQPWISKKILDHLNNFGNNIPFFELFKLKTKYLSDQKWPYVNTKRLLVVAKSLVFINTKALCNVSGRATYATAPLSIVKLYYSCLLSQFSLGSGLEEKPKFYGYTKLINLMFPQQIFKFAWSISTVWKMDISAIKMTEF